MCSIVRREMASERINPINRERIRRASTDVLSKESTNPAIVRPKTRWTSFRRISRIGEKYDRGCVKDYGYVPI